MRLSVGIVYIMRMSEIMVDDGLLPAYIARVRPRLQLSDMKINADSSLSRYSLSNVWSGRVYKVSRA